MEKVSQNNIEKIIGFFDECEDSCILSAFSGSNGEVYADDENNPTVALAKVADYFYIAGKKGSNNIEEAVRFTDKVHENGDYNIRVFGKEIEEVLKKIYKDRVYVYSRFATVRSFENMDFEKLKNVVEEKKKEYELRLIDRELYSICRETEWMKNFTIGFDSYKEWKANGLGVLFLKDGVPISGASSYSSYPGGIEIEIITREDFRKQGLAYASGAALLLECKNRDLIASWDAAHEKSLALAMKLGYKFLYEYRIFGIKGLQQ